MTDRRGLPPWTESEYAERVRARAHHLPPAAWLTVNDPDDTERQYRWPRAMALPRVGEHVRLDHGDHAEEVRVVAVVHLLTVATGSHMPCIHAIPEEDLMTQPQPPAHTGQSPILRYFEYEHLRPPLAAVSSWFHALAHDIERDLPAGAEKSTALRKLLESKDAAVRATLDLPTQDQAADHD